MLKDREYKYGLQTTNLKKNRLNFSRDAQTVTGRYFNVGDIEEGEALLRFQNSTFNNINSHHFRSNILC